MKNLLLIENDDATINQILSILSKKEYSIDIVDNIFKGYKQTLKSLPDLIICSRTIYDRDSYYFEESEIFNRLSEETYASNIPFIYIIDNKTPKKKGGVSTGFDFYIKKPFTKTELIKVIELSLAKYHTVKKRSEQQLNELRGSISFSLPHEFFTPLNGILGFSEILTKEFDNLSRSEIMDMLKYINKDAIRLKKLTENILGFTQLEIIGKTPERLEALRKSNFINPRELIFNTAHQIAKDYLREVDLILETEDAFIRISEEYLKKVLSEIIDNAFKFSKKGTYVNVSILKIAKYVKITISDNGIGMTPEQISSIGAYMQFNRKQQDQQGPGLGLIIAKKITELHGGDFIIESSLQEGTRIEIIFYN